MELDRKVDFCAFSPQLQPGFSFVGVRRFIMLIRVRCVNQLLTAEPLWASAAQADAVPAKKTINGSGSLLRGELALRSKADSWQPGSHIRTHSPADADIDAPRGVLSGSA